MINGFSVFDVEEQDVLNHTTQNENLRFFSRQEAIQRLDFVLAITSDEDVLYLYEGLKVKLSNLTDNEWSKVRDVLPSSLLYSDDDRELLSDNAIGFS